MANSNWKPDLLNVRMLWQLLYISMFSLLCSAAIPWAHHADVQDLHGPSMLIVCCQLSPLDWWKMEHESETESVKLGIKLLQFITINAYSLICLLLAYMLQVVSHQQFFPYVIVFSTYISSHMLSFINYLTPCSSFSWEANTHLARQEIPCILRNLMFTTLYITTDHSTLPC
jgi:hypothetical protein